MSHVAILNLLSATPHGALTAHEISSVLDVQVRKVRTILVDLLRTSQVTRPFSGSYHYCTAGREADYITNQVARIEELLRQYPNGLSHTYLVQLTRITNTVMTRVLARSKHIRRIGKVRKTALTYVLDIVDELTPEIGRAHV